VFLGGGPLRPTLAWPFRDFRRTQRLQPAMFSKSNTATLYMRPSTTTVPGQARAVSQGCPVEDPVADTDQAGESSMIGRLSSAGPLADLSAN
jgi:hypothetical protein